MTIERNREDVLPVLVLLTADGRGYLAPAAESDGERREALARLARWLERQAELLPGFQRVA